jgi:predicted MFS family arabinose efflux permease
MRNPERNASRLLPVLLAFNFGAVFLGRNALDYLMPFAVTDLGLTNTQIGLLSSGLALMWALSGFGLTTFAAPRFPAKTLLIYLGLLVAATALASAAAASFLTLLASRLAYGLFCGPVMPVTQSVMAQAASRRHRGLQMSMVQSVASNLVAAILGPAVLVPIAAIAGWRIALTCAAVLLLLSSTLIARFLIVPRREVVAPAGQGGLLRSLLAAPNVRRCGLISIAMVGWLITSVTFYPLYLTRAAHASSAQMGLLMTAVGLGGLAGSLLLPYLSDRWGRRRALMVGGLLGLLGPLTLYHPGSPAATGTALLLSSLAGGTFPLFMATVPAESLPPDRAPAGMGLVQGLGESLGGVGTPYLAGVLADAYGLQAVLLVIGSCAAIATVIAAGVTEGAPDV